MARLLAGSGASGAAPELIDRLERATAEPAPKAGERVEAPVPSAEAAAGPVPAALPPADTIRLARARLDALLLQAEDLLVPKLASEERVREARALLEELAGRGKAANPGLEARARELLGHLVSDHRTSARRWTDSRMSSGG